MKNNPLLNGKPVYMILLFCYCLHPFRGAAQQVKDIIPPSPATAQFMKYLHYNVSAYNGLPEISIPLYEIKLSNMTIPIALNYHASGIRYLQQNGDVGVGWSISPGYRISRTMYGRPDEQFAMPPITEINDSMNYYIPGLARDKYLGKFVHNLESQRPKPNNNLRLDGEYDQFNFLLPEESGSFIISDRINKTVKAIEGANIRFEYQTGYILGNFSITGHKLLDQKGNTYHFGTTPADPTPMFESNVGAMGGNLPTAWALREIVTPRNEKVSISYNKTYVFRSRQDLQSISLTENGACQATVPGSNNNDGVGETQEHNIFYPTQITTDKEIIQFTRAQTTSYYTLQKIEVFSAETGKLIKRVDFAYSSNAFHEFLDFVRTYDNTGALMEEYKLDYFSRSMTMSDLTKDQWGFYMPGNYINNLWHQQFQDDPIRICEITETGEAGNCNNSLNNFTSGFLVKDNNTTTPDFFSLKKITYPTGGSTEFVYEPHKFKEWGVAKSGGGQRIKEIHSYDAIRSNPLIKRYIYGANEDGFGTAQSPLDYKFFASEKVHFIGQYGEPSDATPVIVRDINYSTTAFGDVDSDGFIGSAVIYPEVVEEISSNSNGNQGRTKFVYDLAFSRFSSGGFNHGTSNYGCTNSNYFEGYNDNYVKRYDTWLKPVLLEKSIYEKSGTTFNLVQKEEYGYMTQMLFGVKGIKVKPFATAIAYPDAQPQYYNWVNSFYDHGTYEINGGRKDMNLRKITTYGSGGTSLTQQTDLAINVNGHVIWEKTATNTGLIIKEFSYPDQFTGYNTSNDLNNSVNKLKEFNMMGTVLESRTYRQNTGETTKRLLEASFMEYLPATPLLRRTFRTELPVASTTFTPATVTGNLIVKDAAYKPYHSIDAYDANGNILQMHLEHQKNESFIWDHNQTQVIAHVTNGTQQQIAYTSFESNGKGNWTYVPALSTDATAPTGKKVHTISPSVYINTLPAGNYEVTYWVKGAGTVLVNGNSGNLLATHNGWSMYRHELTSVTAATLTGTNAVIDELRLYPQNAEMVSFTYDPQIGITSQTAPSGEIKYYEYDTYNRLRLIRNRSGQIVQQYQYKFQETAP